MKRTAMFLEYQVGMSLDANFLSMYCNSDEVGMVNSRLHGDFVRWTNDEINHITDEQHLVMAPNGSDIIVNEQYEGKIYASKSEGKWNINYITYHYDSE